MKKSLKVLFASMAILAMTTSFAAAAEMVDNTAPATQTLATDNSNNGNYCGRGHRNHGRGQGNNCQGNENCPYYNNGNNSSK
jgi:Spy/CpxP family protein refolding chaperone